MEKSRSQPRTSNIEARITIRGRQQGRGRLKTALGCDDATLTRILSRYQIMVERFTRDYRSEMTHIVNDARVRRSAVDGVMRRLDDASVRLGKLNATETELMKMLVHNLSGGYEHGIPTYPQVQTFLDVLSNIDIPAKWRKKGACASMRPRAPGHPADNAFRRLADEIVELWHDQGRKIDRSKRNGVGIVSLTAMLAACFEVAVGLHHKRGSDGRPAQPKLSHELAHPAFQKKLLSSVEEAIRRHKSHAKSVTVRENPA